MQGGVALVEGGSDPSTLDPEPDGDVMVTGGQQPRGQFDVQAGGRDGNPLVQIPTSGGSIELGYEDIFLALVALDLAARAVRIWMEVR